RAVLYSLRVRLDRGVVRAPFAGTITYLVPAGAWVTPGTAIAKLSGTGGFYLTAALSPRDARRLRSGIPVRIRAEGHSWTGMVYAVGERAGAGGLVAVYMKCGCRLFANEFAQVQLRIPAVAGLAVPSDAVVMTDGKTTVYRIVAGRAQPVPVRVVHVGRHWTWLQGSLTPGMPIVTAGAGRIRPGTPVAIRRTQ
ncbi:MAG: efflux RND transporter periplasmic adaptor subunit, partial [Acidiferrobacteraceae bacterium]